VSFRSLRKLSLPIYRHLTRLKPVHTCFYLEGLQGITKSLFDLQLVLPHISNYYSDQLDHDGEVCKKVVLTNVSKCQVAGS
jgi:hypothetical protein